MRLGLFPGGIDARDVTQPDTVEYFRFLNRARRERFELALEDPKSDRVCPVTVLNGFDVLGLLTGFPNRFYSGNKEAGEVKKDRLNGLGGVGGGEDRGQGGRSEADPMPLWRKDQLYDVRDESLFQVRVERVLVKLPVQLGSAVVEEGVRTQTEDVVVSVVGVTIRRGTE